MKILYHHRIGSKDGQYVHIEEMVSALRAAGHEVRLVGPDGFDEQAFGGESGLVTRLKARIPAGVYELLEFGYNTVDYRRLARAVREFRPDVIYERYNLYLLSGAVARRRLHVPLLLEINAPLFAERSAYSGLRLAGPARWAECRAWRAADHVFTVTRVLADRIAAAGVDERDLTITPNGVNHARFAADPDVANAKTALRIDPQATVLGFVGFAREWHGLDAVIELMAEYRDTRELYFLLVGAGPITDTLKSQAAAAGLADRVIITGVVERDDVQRYVNAFDVAMLPNVVAYASPLKLFEYMACAKAIVAPRQTNLEEIVSDRGDALLFEPGSRGDFLRAVRSLIDDGALRSRLGAAARDTLLERDLSWTANAAKVAAVAARLAARPGVTRRARPKLASRWRSLRSRSSEAPPAVVVGGGLNALGVVRSLGVAGVPIRLVAGGPAMPAALSRYPETVLYDDREPASVVDALLDLAERQPGPRRPLILTEEEKVAAVSAHHERLSSAYHVLLPPAATVSRLLHKDGFRQAAEAGGQLVPRSVHVRSKNDLAALGALTPPLIVKPSGRQAAYLARFERAYRVDERAEAESLLTDMLAVSDDLIVQEWIDGDDCSIYFCLQFLPGDDGPPVSFVGRKLRSWPPETGGTACCVAAPEAAPALVEPTTAFFRSQGVIGFASMEYKKRASTGEYVMIEPTIGRTDFQEEIATLNGVNLPLAGYRWALGQPMPPAQSTSRVYAWRDRDAEANAIAARREIAHPAPGARIVDALWRRDDPAPRLYDSRHRIIVKLKRFTGGAP